MLKTKQLKKGQRFNRLIVIKLNHIKIYIYPDGKRKWNQEFYLCKCDCGKQSVVLKECLRRGDTGSCGCLRIKKHGLYKSRIYGIWAAIKQRCRNKNCSIYYKYGGKGIDVCDLWFDDFISFYNWAMANGYKENLTIDRIDNNKGYFKENCRWATYKEQILNRRNAIMIFHNGFNRSLKEWSEILNVRYGLLYDRYRYGWSANRILNEKINQKKGNKNV